MRFQLAVSVTITLSNIAKYSMINNESAIGKFTLTQLSHPKRLELSIALFT